MTISYKSYLWYSITFVSAAGLVASFVARRHLDKKPIMVVDFEASMQVKAFSHILADNNTLMLLNMFKQVYDKNKNAVANPAEIIKVPRILHVIWLGGRLPKAYEPFYQSWLDYHPDWTHIFWTDNPVHYEFGTVICKTFDELNTCLHASRNSGRGMRIVVDTHALSFDNKPFFDASRNYGERSDILKWEIVYRYGGVYVDTDFECLQPLDNLNYCYDFYTGLQPLDTNRVQLGAALFAAIPGHPIMRECVEGIKRNQHIVPIVSKTGPIHFTRSFLQKVTEGNYINIAFPASYFYPCGYEERDLPPTKWAKNEAFAIHHWAGSWLKAEGFVRS